MKLWLLLLLALAGASCSHTISYREVERETVRAGSERIERHLVLPPAARISGRYLNLKLSAETTRHWLSYKETWGVRRYNSYSIGRDIFLRPVLVGFGVGLAGVLFWGNPASDHPPDRNGDGSYSVIEYLGDTIAWFNPLSAVPFGRGDSKEEVLVASAKDAGPGEAKREVQKHNLRRKRVVIEIRTPTSQRSKSSTTDYNSSIRVDLLPHLVELAGEKIQVHICASIEKQEFRAALPSLSALAGCELLRRLQPGAFAKLPAGRRTRVVEAYLAGIRARASGKLQGDPLQLVDALDKILPREPGLAGQLRPVLADRLERLARAGSGGAALALARVLLRRYPGDPAFAQSIDALFRQQVEGLQARGRGLEALKLAREAARVLPESAGWPGRIRDVHLRLTQDLWERGEQDAALDQAAALVAAARQDQEVRTRVEAMFDARVKTATAAGRREQALAAAKRARRLFGGAWEGRARTLALAWVDELWERGDRPAALRASRETLELWPRPEVAARVAALHEQRLEQLKTAGAWGEATTLAATAAALFPKDAAWSARVVHTHEAWIASLREAGDLPGAVRETGKLLAGRSRRPELVRRCGDAWLKHLQAKQQEGQLEGLSRAGIEILRWFGKREDLRGLVSDVLAERMDSLREAGRNTDALQLAVAGQKVLRQDPRLQAHLAGLRESLVREYGTRREWSLALAQAQALARSHAEDQALQQRVAKALRPRLLELRASGELAAAAAFGERLLRMYPKHADLHEEIAGVQIELMDQRQREGKWELALKLGEGLQRRFRPDTLRARRATAVFTARLEGLRSQGKWREALQVAERGRKAFPKVDELWWNQVSDTVGSLIESEWAAGKYEDAIEVAREYLRRSPPDPRLQDRVAACYVKRARVLRGSGESESVLRLAGRLLPLLPRHSVLRTEVKDLFVAQIKRHQQAAQRGQLTPLLLAAEVLFPRDPWVRKVRSELAPSELGDVSLADAIDLGLVDAQVTGSGIRSVRLSVTRRVLAGFVVRVPPGTFFVCRGKAQNMVGTEPVLVDLRAGKSRSVSVSAACANRTRAIPRSASSFRVRSGPNSADLARLAPHLPGKRFGVKQAAVWIVTDDATRAQLARLVRRRVGMTFGGTPMIKDADVLEAAQLLTKAGIELRGKAIHGWLQARKAKK